MRPKDVKNLLKSLYPDGPCVFLIGASGVGKSEIVKQVADELGVGFCVLDMILQDEVVMHGIPDLNQDWLEWKPSKEIPFEGNDAFPENGILFLDEFNCARRGLQTLGYQLALERRIGSHRLKKGWYPVFAGNRVQDQGEIFDVPGPLKNRVLKVDFTVNLQDWLQYAISHDVSDEIIGYIMWSAQGIEEGVDVLGNLINLELADKDWNWPTPRAWARNVDFLLKKGIRSLEAIAGCIGQVAASEFLGYLEVVSKLPKVEDFLAGKAEFPAEPHLQYALIASMIKYASNQERIDKVLLRVTQGDIPEEYAAMLIQQICSTHTAEFFASPYQMDALAKAGEIFIEEED